MRKIVNVNGISVETLESAGRGSAIFLCHGNSSAANSFEPLIECEFGKTHHLVAISFPGHGESDMIPDCSIAKLGRVVVEVVRHFRPNHYWLVGHSLGGHALLEVLDAFPDALGLTLVSAPPVSLETLPLAFKPDPTAGCLFKGELNDTEVDLLASCFSEKVGAPILARIKDNIRRTDPSFRPAFGASLAAGLLPDERRLLAASRIPVALMAGTADKFLEFGYYSTLTDCPMWKGAPIVFQGNGHALHLEEPECFQQTLAEFIRS